MIDKSFVDAIKEGVAATTITVDGKPYATRPVYNPPLPDEPVCDPVTLHTLDGLVAFWNEHIEDNHAPDAAAGPFVHIVDHATVQLPDAVFGVHRQREIMAEANAITPASAFQFEKFMDLETFMIRLQAQFAPDGDAFKIMKLLGTIRDEKVTTSADDGTVQVVTARVGIALDATAAVPNPVVLRPFRTFPEIEQPASKFILRLQSGDRPGSKPTAALFEADGGAWKLAAIASIREYLAGKLPGAVIVA